MNCTYVTTGMLLTYSWLKFTVATCNVSTYMYLHLTAKFSIQKDEVLVACIDVFCVARWCVYLPTH